MTEDILILASASPRRRELLAVLDIPFRVVPPAIDERIGEGEPAEIAVRLAQAKAEAICAQYCDALIIAADTLVVLDGKVLGKPNDPEEARQMLEALRGRWHEVTTGLSVIDGRAEKEVSAAVTTRVLMRRYTAAEIAQTIARGTPFDKAGAYAIQDELFRPVERYESCYCNVVGLPLWALLRLLRQARPDLSYRRPDMAIARCAECPDRLAGSKLPDPFPTTPAGPTTKAHQAPPPR